MIQPPNHRDGNILVRDPKVKSDEAQLLQSIYIQDNVFLLHPKNILL